MEQPTPEKSPGKVLERVRRVSDRLWHLIESKVLTIPVESESVRAVGRVAAQLTAPKLEKAASFFRRSAATLGKI